MENAAFHLETIEYESVDDGVAHVYAMKEIVGTRTNVVYDEHVVAVSATPHDRGDGTMNVDVVYDGGEAFSGITTSDAAVFINSIDTARKSVYVGKVWKQAGSTIDWPGPATVDVDLIATVDGNSSVADTATLSAGETGRMFNNLPVTDSATGHEIAYSVVEHSRGCFRDIAGDCRRMLAG